MKKGESARKAPHTIRDIARVAGVSPKTVSFVLNGRAGVADSTRKHILRIVRELDYHPNAAARALRDQLPRSIGVIFPSTTDAMPLSHSLWNWLHEDFTQIFGSRGYYVTFDMASYAGSRNGDYARGVWEQAFGPCFLAGPLALTDRVVPRLHERGVPYVAVTRLDSFPQCSAATVDYEQAAYRSARYLLERGHTRIGLLKAFQGYQTGLERRRGYVRALREAGLSVDESLIRPVAFTSDSIVDHLHALLSDQRITAIIDASSAEDSAALREGARRAGRRFDADLESVVWSYRYDTGVLPEATAHMCLPLRQAAVEGLEQLAAWIEGGRNGPIQILYQPTLLETTHEAGLPEPLRVFYETG
ncbi:MAG: LacI family DNA-binding transcriptional regulator [Candidatus Hydrogenedentales bacterium]